MPDTGLLFIANEAPKILSYYVPVGGLTAQLVSISLINLVLLFASSVVLL